MRWFLILMLILRITPVPASPLSAAPLQAESAQPATGTVGIEGQVLLRWSGKPLEVAPIPDNSPVLVRIASITPGEGDEMVYDLRWIAMLPGDHDLSRLLRHGEGAAATQLPSMGISVSSLLKKDHEGGLNQIPGPISPILGFPEWVPWAVAVFWLILPLTILTLIRWLRKAPVPEPEAAPPPTLAELLRPLVIAALAGELDDAKKATMERILLAHWRVELDLGSYRHGEGIQKLRSHPEAGILLVTVEQWLHSGRDEAVSDKQLEDLLAPYATPISEPVEEGS